MGYASILSNSNSNSREETKSTYVYMYPHENIENTVRKRFMCHVLF